MNTIQKCLTKDTIESLPKWLYDQAEKQAINKFNQITKDKELIKLCGSKCQVNIISETAPIFVLTGYHSYLASILLGKQDSSSCSALNVLMIPPNHVVFSNDELSILSDREIYFLTSNIPCSNASTKRLLKDFEHQLATTVKSVSIIDLVEFMDENITDYCKGKLDLSIAVENWRNKNSDNFVNLLIYFCQKED